jgi:hypothetical protein
LALKPGVTAAEGDGGFAGATAWRWWRQPPWRSRWRWRCGPATICRSETIKSVRACVGILLVVRSPLFFSHQRLTRRVVLDNVFRVKRERQSCDCKNYPIHSFLLFLYMRDDHRRGAMAYGHDGSAARRLPARDMYCNKFKLKILVPFFQEVMTCKIRML